MTTVLVGAFLLALQAPQAAVAGIVTDRETGDPVPGAVVSLDDLDRHALTDATGRYAIPGVPPGPQHLVVRILGYATRTLHALVPGDGEVRINVTLEPDPIPRGEVEVRPRVAVRGLEEGVGMAFPDRSISIAAVRAHPLLAEPDAFLAFEGGDVVVRPESPSGIHVRGGGSDQTAYLLDGIPVLSPYHAAGLFSAWNPDALARIDLAASTPRFDAPAALSGSVEGTLVRPGPELRARGGLSTGQARLTLDGPLGIGDGGYMVSWRSGFPGVLAPRGEASYLRGETGDRLGTLELPAPVGRLRLLAFDSENEIDASATVDGVGPSGPGPPGNGFEWSSRSLGGEWSGTRGTVELRLRAWEARAAAEARWTRDDLRVDLSSERRDRGIGAVLEWGGDVPVIRAGLRLERIGTSYRLGEAGSEESLDLTHRVGLATLSLRHVRSLGSRAIAELGSDVSVGPGGLRVGPSTRVRWTPWEVLSVTAGLARSHQYAQSVRNPESVAGSVFPPDLFVGAGAPGVPVAQSDLAVASVELRPLEAVRIEAQVYGRAFEGVLLVAPGTGEPFATDALRAGKGDARGVAVDFAAGGTRFGVTGGYGWQQVRLAAGEAAYTPGHAASHHASAGVILFPTPTFSVRGGATAILGRRATAVRGAFEWEACNLLDRGCEFGGSPGYDPLELGSGSMPGYLRLDLGLRKHWHLRVGDRDALVALFGTVTNVLGRRNLLTWAVDPADGTQEGIEMRPRAPLVVGLDWRY